MSATEGEHNTILCQFQGTGSRQPSVYSPQIPIHKAIEKTQLSLPIVRTVKLPK